MFGNFVEVQRVEATSNAGEPKFIDSDRKISLNLANIESLEIVGDNVTCVTRKTGTFMYVKGTPESLFESSIRQSIERESNLKAKLMKEYQEAQRQEAPIIHMP